MPLVCGIESVGDLDGEVNQFLNLKRPSEDRLLQGLALQKLHHDERTPLMLTDLVNGADARMIQRRSRPGFPAKALERLLVARNVIGKKLERNEPTELSVVGLVHHAHAATTQLFDDVVMRNGLADHWVVMLGGSFGQVNRTEGCIRIEGKMLHPMRYARVVRWEWSRELNCSSLPDIFEYRDQLRDLCRVEYSLDTARTEVRER
jgi:hypothetical protein